MSDKHSAVLPLPSVAELMIAWGRGWTRSRGTPDPVPFPGGFRVDVAAPGHRVRYVLHSRDDALLRRLAREHGAPGTCLKAPGDPAAFRAALPGWAMDGAGYLMTTAFTAGTGEPPAGYTLELQTSGAVTVATVCPRHGREVAASARLALAGGYGIVDKVATAPEHRRRGLGTVLLRALGDHAWSQGVPTGILCATDEGRALYTALGWRVHADVSGALQPEEQPADG